MGTFHFYDFIALIVFIQLMVLSLNEIVLGQLERDLGNHVVLEHMLFFSIGALSVYVAERILKFIISIQRNSFVGTNSEIRQSNWQYNPVLESNSANDLQIKYTPLELDSYCWLSRYCMAYTSNFWLCFDSWLCACYATPLIHFGRSSHIYDN